MFVDILFINLLYSIYCVIFQVLRAAETGIHVIAPHCDLISQAVLLVGDDNLSTAQQSVNVLTSLGTTVFTIDFHDYCKGFNYDQFLKYQHFLQTKPFRLSK